MSSVARLYAQVLFDLNEECFKELITLREALSQEDIDFFHSSLFSLENKKQVIQKLGLSNEMTGFLYQLTLKRRWSYFMDICDFCQTLLDQKKKIVRGVIYTAKTLTDEELKKIEMSLKQFFKNKTVLLQMQERKDLIGGVRVEIGGYSFDNSVLYHINQLKEQVTHYEK